MMKVCGPSSNAPDHDLFDIPEASHAIMLLNQEDVATRGCLEYPEA